MSIWTPEQVDRLQRWQNCGNFHPYTCGNRGDSLHGAGEGLLVPTVRGWICQYCDWHQTTAPDFFLTREPPRQEY